MPWFSFRWGKQKKIDTFAPIDQDGCGDLYKNPGILKIKSIRPFACFDIAGIKITPVSLVHSKPTLGYCIEHDSGKLAYLTDTVGLPKETLVFLQNWQPDLVVLDCSYPPSAEIPRNHNDLTRALQIFTEIKPKRMLLTHIGHELDLWLNDHECELPRGVEIARDEDVITL